MFQHKMPLLCNLFRYPFSLNRLPKNTRAMVHEKVIALSEKSAFFAQPIYLEKYIMFWVMLLPFSHYTYKSCEVANITSKLFRETRQVFVRNNKP